MRSTNAPTARGKNALRSLACSALAVLVVLPGCGSSSSDDGRVSEGQSAGEKDAAGQDTDAGGQDAGECAPLETTAERTFETFVDQHSSCSTDADCTLAHFTDPSLCASPCPVVMNQTGAASAVATASQDCAEFNAQGCTAPAIGCPGFGSPICAAGACALYELDLSESAPFTHGACTALTETYLQSWTPTAAPRDFPLTVTATNGTLYADGSCTAALPSGAITLAKGSTAVTFGFLPAAAGTFSVNIDDGSGINGGITGQAQ